MHFSLEQDLEKNHAAHLMRQEEDFGFSEVCVTPQMLLNVFFNLLSNSHNNNRGDSI